MTAYNTLNPIVESTTTAELLDSGGGILRLLQWVDNKADIADDDDLVIVMGGQTLTYKVQLEADKVDNCVVMQIGPFNPGIHVRNINITTIDHGVLHIWLQ